MTSVSKVSRIRKRLLREHRRVKSWRVLESLYGVNHKYIYDLAVLGIEPKNQEIRYRLGLDARSKPEWLECAVCFLREREKL
jgi:hypothetical protein